MKISCVIPCRDPDDPSLKNLIRSIEAQEYPKEHIEIIVSTQGDSEEAKGRGTKKATGDVIAYFCADNVIVDRFLFAAVQILLENHPKTIVGAYTRHYTYVGSDDSLNRYFALMGVNDPIPWWLKKADRLPRELNDDMLFELMMFRHKVPSLGDNGFFYRKEFIEKADLDHYYPMDCAEDLRQKGFYIYIRMNVDSVWHRTANNNLIGFLLRRYRYARDLYCDRRDRRWKVVGTKTDYWKCFLFVLYSLSIIGPLFTALRGFLKFKDFAWFWHIPVCVGFSLMYTFLAVRTWLKRPLSSPPSEGKKNLKPSENFLKSNSSNNLR